MSVATDYRAIFDPQTKPLESVWHCPVCKCGKNVAHLGLDRYDNRLEVIDCVICGLSYFGLRMTADAYSFFYQSGAYRRLVSAYHGREMGGCERRYGGGLLSFIWRATVDEFERIIDGQRLLDIGGAPFGVFADRGAVADVIDPAIDGQTAETFDPAGRQWDLITVCQTVDHLLEPGAVFKKLAGCLAPGGVLFFDAVDFDSTREYKIDHPCNFNARSATMLAHVAGLRIDKMERSGNHLRFLLRHWT